MLDKYYSGPVSFDVLDLRRQIQRIKSLLEIIKKNNFGNPKSSVDEGLVDDVLSSVEVETAEGVSLDDDMLDDTGNPTQPKQQKQQFEDEREQDGERESVSLHRAKFLLFISLPAETPLSTLFH